MRQSRPLPLILARELAANVATPYLVLDAEGTLVYFNERAERIIGATPAEIGELREQECALASRSSGQTGHRCLTRRRRRHEPAVSSDRCTTRFSTPGRTAAG
jgi:PAS domain S-box-containing protein